MRRPLTLAAVALLALLGVACGDDGDTDGSASGGGMNEHMSGGDRHDAPSDTAAGAREIDVVASSFAFEPDEIRVGAGEDFTIVLSSTDILHDFEVDGVDGHVSAAAGETEAGGFRVDEPGTYRYVCTIEGHETAGMVGTLVVE